MLYNYEVSREKKSDSFAALMIILITCLGGSFDAGFEGSRVHCAWKREKRRGKIIYIYIYS